MKMIRLIKKLWGEHKAHKKQRLCPGSQYIIEITDDCISCKRPDGEIDIVEFNKLEKVEIQTNDLGPFVEDVYWILYQESAQCIIPQMATNQALLADRLLALPGFDQEEFMNAMICTGNNQFTLWNKNNQPSEIIA